MGSNRSWSQKEIQGESYNKAEKFIENRSREQYPMLKECAKVSRTCLKYMTNKYLSKGGEH